MKINLIDTAVWYPIFVQQKLPLTPFSCCLGGERQRFNSRICQITMFLVLKMMRTIMYSQLKSTRLEKVNGGRGQGRERNGQIYLPPTPVKPSAANFDYIKTVAWGYRCRACLCTFIPASDTKHRFHSMMS